MFMGEYNHTVDAKGRLIVPSKFREQLGDEFVVTKGLDGCLFVYENSEWKALEEKLHALPLTNANARKFSRFFLAGATACEVDKQGRILLLSWWELEAGLKSGPKTAGWKPILMMTWKRLQKIWKDWEFKWILDTHQFCFTKQLTVFA